MSASFEQLWSRLSIAGLVEGPMPETGELDAPWYVSVLMAFFGWLAAVFLLGFVGFGLVFVFENSFASIVVGGLMISGAFWLLRAPKNAFLEHFSLAISLAGQVFVIWGLSEVANFRTAWVWFAVMVFQFMLAVFMPGVVHRVFSSVAASLALSIALSLLGAPYLASGILLLGAALLWLNEFRYPDYMLQIRSLGMGLVLAVINIKGSLLFGYSGLFWMGHGRRTDLLMAPWVGELLTECVLLFVVWQLLRRFNNQLTMQLRLMILLSTLVIAAASFEAPGITVGIVILLLGFADSHRVLIGLGIAALLFYSFAYYYTLETTLLMKSLTLTVLGVVLLSSRWLMRHFLSPDQPSGKTPAPGAPHAN